MRQNDAVFVEERYTESMIEPDAQSTDRLPALSGKVLNISVFLSDFVTALGIDPVHYGAMDTDRP